MSFRGEVFAFEKRIIGPYIRLRSDSDGGDFTIWEGEVDFTFLRTCNEKVRITSRELTGTYGRPFEIHYEGQVFTSIHTALQEIPFSKFTSISELTVVFVNEPGYVGEDLRCMGQIFAKAYGLVFFCYFGTLFPFPKKDIPPEVVYEVVEANGKVYYYEVKVD